MKIPSCLLWAAPVAGFAALAIEADSRPAAAIAAEKNRVDALLAKTAPAPAAPAAPAGRPIPGEMGRARPANPDNEGQISLLGVTSAKTGITSAYVDARDRVDDAKRVLQPKIDALNKQKDHYSAEIQKLRDQIWQLEKQRDAATGDPALDQLKYEERERRRAEIRRQFEGRIEAVREQQDAWERKKNEADEAMQEVWQDPALLKARRELDKQIATDARRHLSPSR